MFRSRNERLHCGNAQDVRERGWRVSLKALLQVLTNTIYRFKRVGLEAGPLSQWLYSVLRRSGLPVICVETRHSGPC